METTSDLDQLAPRYRHVFARMIVSEVTDFSELLALVRAEQAANPGTTVFLTLDDAGQAFYTSGHATASAELEVPVDDLDFLADPAAEDALQHRQFAHTSAQLARPDLQVPWADLRGTRESEPGELTVLAERNEDPAGLLDDVVLLLHVPAADPTAALAALPNGYFSVDWNVFQNHAVTRRLAAGYGYRPLGIGASWLGFVRDEPLPPGDAGRLVGELAEIYGSPGAEGWGRLGKSVTERETLFLGYTENYAE